MKSKQNLWQFNTALAMTILTVLLGSNSCNNLFSSWLTKPLQTVSEDLSWIYAIAFSPNGEYLVSSSYDKQIQIWHLPSSKLLHTLKGHDDVVKSLAISPDNQILASGSGDNRIKLWNLETGKLILTIEGHSDDVQTLAISPDGKWLASGSNDKTIRLWNMSTGKQQNLFRDQQSLRTIAFSPDNQTLISANKKETIKIWQLDSGKVLASWQADTKAVGSPVFNLDEQSFTSGSSDANNKTWEFNPSQIPHLEGISKTSLVSCL